MVAARNCVKLRVPVAAARAAAAFRAAQEQAKNFLRNRILDLIAHAFAAVFCAKVLVTADLPFFRP